MWSILGETTAGLGYTRGRRFVTSLMCRFLYPGCILLLKTLQLQGYQVQQSDLAAIWFILALPFLPKRSISTLNRTIDPHS